MKKLIIVFASLAFLVVGAAMLTAQEQSCAEIAKQQCQHLTDVDEYNACWNEAYEACTAGQ